MSAETETSSREGARPSRPATDSIADGVRSRTTYAVSLDMFEGPLDLLLHLVRRHELDILDIPIAFITEKYIEYISFARSLDIEIAGEYLLMAATLAFLKSRELLPAAPGEDEESEDEEEGVDPREELIRRLIEYERFRGAGDELGNRPLFGRDVFPRGGSPDVILPEPGLAPVTLFRLAEAYNRVLDRAKIREEHTVVIEPVTVRQRMRQLSLLLSDKPRLEFESLFLQQVWSSERELRQMLVVTLMSVLEMVKLGLLGVYQAQGSDALELERTVEVDEMTQAVSVFREEGEEDDPLTEVAVGAPAEVRSEPEAVEAIEQSSEPELVEASKQSSEAEPIATSEVEAVDAVEASSDVEAIEQRSEPELIEAAEPESAEVSSGIEAGEQSSEPDAVEQGEQSSEPDPVDAIEQRTESETTEAAERETVELSSEPETVEASSDPEPIEADEPEAIAVHSEPEIEAVEVSSDAEPIEADEPEPETVEQSSEPEAVDLSSDAEPIEADEPEPEAAEQTSEPEAVEPSGEREEPPEQVQTLSPDEGETE